MKHLTIKARLIAAMAFLSALLAAIGLGGLHSLSQTNAALQTVYDDRLLALGMLHKVGLNVQRTELLLTAPAVSASGAGLADLQEAVGAQGAEADRVWDAYMRTFLTPEEARLARQFAALRAAMGAQAVQPALAALAAGDKDQAAALARTALEPAARRTLAALEQLAQLQLDVGRQEYQQSQAKYALFRLLAVGAVLAGAIAGCAMGWWLLRAILRPLERAVALAEAVAQGDLSQRIDQHSRDEMGRLTRALAAMSGSLAAIVANVRQGTETIAVAASEIAAGSSDLSARTENQACSLQETASSMEELNGAVQNNTESARTASALAHGVSETAARGGQAVAQVMAGMAAIDQSSARIADIIGVIDAIAFQTNLLALNAAVEAARSGEHGRGFAVVAAEVRSLAQRSAAAAGEIKTLIGASLAQVGEGNRLAREAGATMDEVVGGVAQLARIMSDIRSASDEQSQGLDQVNQAVAAMDSVTQQNAALVEQAAAAAEALREQAGELERAVSVFRLVAAPAVPALRLGRAALPLPAAPCLAA